LKVPTFTSTSVRTPGRITRSFFAALQHKQKGKREVQSVMYFALVLQLELGSAGSRKLSAGSETTTCIKNAPTMPEGPPLNQYCYYYQSAKSLTQSSCRVRGVQVHLLTDPAHSHPSPPASSRAELGTEEKSKSLRWLHQQALRKDLSNLLNSIKDQISDSVSLM